MCCEVQPFLSEDFNETFQVCFSYLKMRLGTQQGLQKHGGDLAVGVCAPLGIRMFLKSNPCKWTGGHFPESH